MFIMQHIARLWQRILKKGKGKDRGDPLKTPDSTGTAIKAQLPDFRASFTREESMLIYGYLKSNCKCHTHKNL